MSVLEAGLNQCREEADRFFIPAMVSILVGLVTLSLLIEVFSLIAK